MGEFNPREHLIDLKGKDYLPVAWRIAWLRDAHPDAVLRTMVVEHSEAHAIFRAEVSLANDGGYASGYGSETQSDFGDFLEKAETKAIGRALAALGFGTQFCDDFEEGGAVTDAPIQRKGPVKNYDGQRAAAGTGGAGQARNELRRAFTKKFGPDEQAAFEFMEKVEPGAISGTMINYSVITPDRCKEIVALTEPYDPSAEDYTNVERPA